MPPFGIDRASVPPLAPGQTFQFTTAGGEASWISSNAQVAIITKDGLLTASAPGSTYIIAVSTVNLRLRDSVLVQVYPSGPKGPLLLWIDSLKIHGTNTPVDRTAVRDSIAVSAVHDIPNGVTATAMQLLMNTQKVCDWPISQQRARYSCTINTRAFPNGTATLQLELMSHANVMARSTTQITLTN